MAIEKTQLMIKAEFIVFFYHNHFKNKVTNKQTNQKTKNKKKMIRLNVFIKCI